MKHISLSIEHLTNPILCLLNKVELLIVPMRKCHTTNCPDFIPPYYLTPAKKLLLLLIFSEVFTIGHYVMVNARSHVTQKQYPKKTTRKSIFKNEGEKRNKIVINDVYRNIENEINFT